MPNVTHQMRVSTPRRQKEIATFERRTIETQDVRESPLLHHTLCEKSYRQPQNKQTPSQD